MSGSFVPPPTIEDIRQALVRPLPGMAGQKKMAPQPPAQSEDRWHCPVDCREAAVLLLLYPARTNNYQHKPGKSSLPELHILLTRRTEYPGVHSGQISFPGGRREGQETLWETALRETKEEVGVLPDTLEIMGRLSSLYVPASNFCIYPFVAFTSSRPTFYLDSEEVAEIIELPLSLLLDPANRKEEVWQFQKYGERLVPFFDVFGHRVWGATAMMLGEFLALLQLPEQ
jgi:8-oxo-dGTP pyrophosphatase MutT (NUDIX family)